MKRITEKDLERLCKRINEATGSPVQTYSRNDDGKLVAQIGNYHISHSYGGVCLHRISSAGGGVMTPLSYGHVPKRDLYNQMCAFLSGLAAEKQL